MMLKIYRNINCLEDHLNISKSLRISKLPLNLPIAGYGDHQDSEMRTKEEYLLANNNGIYISSLIVLICIIKVIRNTIQYKVENSHNQGWAKPSPVRPQFSTSSGSKWQIPYKNKHQFHSYFYRFKERIICPSLVTTFSILKYNARMAETTVWNSDFQ